MSSPFPGFDPFLEAQGYWREFHIISISSMQDALAGRLPDAYEIRIEARPSLFYFEDVSPCRVEEVEEARLAIRRFPNRELVTAIELLSPSNKKAPGDVLYHEKRLELIHQKVHLVELDLLIGGGRLRMKEALPEGHYYALVSRAERSLCEVYAWTIRDRLPTIPIPLQAPDLDIPLDLAAGFARVYQGARYERSINYAAPLDLPLSQQDRAWAEALARAGASPNGL